MVAPEPVFHVVEQVSASDIAASESAPTITLVTLIASLAASIQRRRTSVVGPPVVGWRRLRRVRREASPVQRGRLLCAGLPRGGRG